MLEKKIKMRNKLSGKIGIEVKVASKSGNKNV